MIPIPSLQEYALRAVWASNKKKPLSDKKDLQETWCHSLLARMYADLPRSVYLKDSTKQLFSLYERSLKPLREMEIAELFKNRLIALESVSFLTFRQRVIKTFSLHSTVPVQEIRKAEDPKIFLKKSMEMTDRFPPHIALPLKTWLLSEAVIFGYWQAVSPLVEQGADVDFAFPQDEFEESPFPRSLLFHALLSEDIVMSFVLIKAGASVHREMALDYGDPPKSALDLAKRLYPSEAITQFMEEMPKDAV